MKNCHILAVLPYPLGPGWARDINCTNIVPLTPKIHFLKEVKKMNVLWLSHDDGRKRIALYHLSQ